MNRRFFISFISQIGAGLTVGLLGRQAFAKGKEFSKVPHLQFKNAYGTYGGYGAYGIYGIYGEHGLYGGYGMYGTYGQYGVYGLYGVYDQYGAYGVYGAYDQYGSYGAYGYGPYHGEALDCRPGPRRPTQQNPAGKDVGFESKTNR